MGQRSGSGSVRGLGVHPGADAVRVHAAQVFSRLDREAFEGVLGQWLQERGLSEGEAVAIDGKRLRGIHGDQLPG